MRTTELHGLIVTLVPFAGAATRTIDAFSTSHLPRPVIVLPPDRANDVYRHRVPSTHELGHLVLHGDTAPGDAVQEKEADAFAAELLTPRDEIVPSCLRGWSCTSSNGSGRRGRVGVESLIYRCHEVGRISDATYRRAFQRLSQLRQLGLFARDPVDGFPGEKPTLLAGAYAVAEENALTLARLADELRINLPPQPPGFTSGSSPR